MCVLSKLKNFSLITIMVLPMSVNASAGALQKNSIKQCPDGNYYGYHKDHWHLAEQSNVSSGWSAIGDTFYSDPCPVDTTNSTITEEPTNEIVNNSEEMDSVLVEENVTEDNSLISNDTIDNNSLDNDNTVLEQSTTSDETTAETNASSSNDISPTIENKSTNESNEDSSSPTILETITSLGVIGGGVLLYRAKKKK